MDAIKTASKRAIQKKLHSKNDANVETEVAK